MADANNKKTPLRMCTVCRQMRDKRDLLRVVKTENSYLLDASGKAQGRGAYVCNTKECLTVCIKKRTLNKSYKTQVPNEVYALLQAALDSEGTSDKQ